jgi:hypothetical protein
MLALAAALGGLIRAFHVYREIWFSPDIAA